METTVQLRFLGPIQVEQGDQPVRGFRSRKALALLAYLAGRAEPVPREQLAALFWEDLPETEGRANLSWVLNKLAALLPGCLQSDRHTVRFTRHDACQLDIDAFEALAARHDAASLSAAVALYRGEYLDGLELEGCAEFDLWLVSERERWRQQVATVLDELVARHERAGERAQALAFARRLLALEPWREETHRRLMRLLAHSAQRSAALAQYEACRQTLARELSIAPMRETTALFERIRAADVVARHNLPVHPTPFVARETELAQVLALLDRPDCRLLTITGPGGIGKTRLALQAAAARLDAFIEGACHVPLAGAEFLVTAMAEALRLSFFGSRDPQAQLLNYLRGKEMLLILDGMERLLDGTALLVEILQQAPEVKLLVTSRERLNLRWEWCFPLEGLDYPVPDLPAAAPSPEASGALQLFFQVARQARGSFGPSSRDLPAAVRICQLVEGMPLGIELAAAWAGTRPCEQIAAAIENDLSALTTPLRDAPARHRSVRAAFDHSWQSLTLTEQRAFAGLSVFRHGFDVIAAGAVAGATPEVLDSLVAKSLLRASPGRYEMHELLRQYAEGMLAISPQECAERANGHSAYYAAFLQAQEADLAGPRAAQALGAVRAEIANVRAAWRYAVAQGRLPDIERGLIGLARFYALVGPYQEGESLITVALERARAQAPQDAPALLSRLFAEQARFLNARGSSRDAALAAQAAVQYAGEVIALQAHAHLQWGQSLWLQRDYEAARSRFDQALTLARAAHEPLVEASSLHQLGLIDWHLSDYTGARDHFDQALQLFRASGDGKGESAALLSFGNVCGYQGRYDEAATYYEQALALFRQVGDRKGESVAQINFSLARNLQGYYDEAMDGYRQGLRIARELGDRPDEALALINLGFISGQLGDGPEAAGCCQQALRLYKAVGDRQGESLALACLCLFAHQQGDDATACEHGQQALQLAQTINNRHTQSYALARLGHALAGLGRLSEAAEHYRQALAIRRELGQSNLAMEALAGLARVARAQAELRQAMEWVDEILAHLERNAGNATAGLNGVDEPGRIYWTCYQVLAAAHDPRAPAVLSAAAQWLEAQAARIADPPSRHSFLHGVAAHREIARFLPQVAGASHDTHEPLREVSAGNLPQGL